MAGSQVVKIIIVTVQAGASPVKLDLGAGLGAAGHPVQEPLEDHDHNHHHHHHSLP